MSGDRGTGMNRRRFFGGLIAAVAALVVPSRGLRAGVLLGKRTKDQKWTNSIIGAGFESIRSSYSLEPYDSGGWWLRIHSEYVLGDATAVNARDAFVLHCEQVVTKAAELVGATLDAPAKVIANRGRGELHNIYHSPVIGPHTAVYDSVYRIANGVFLEPHTGPNNGLGWRDPLTGRIEYVAFYLPDYPKSEATA